jgi:aspartyl protease family protein
MAYSSSTRVLITEIASWTFVAASCTLAVIYIDDIKPVVRSVLGLPSPTEMAAAAEKPLPPVQAEQRPDGTVELRAADNGHYHASAEINGRPVDVLVDTGATFVALTYEDAERAGIYPKPSDFTHSVSTANGMARVAPVSLDRVSIGDITVRNVQAFVSERGKLQMTLLGMSFLSRLERVDMRSGILLLQD